MFSPTQVPERAPALSARTELVIREVCESLASRLSIRPQAIVLTGSFARNEGTTLMAGGRLRVLGDIECMVVFPRNTDRGPLQTSLNQQARQLKEELASRGTDCDLEFGAITSEYFHALRPQIFGYELLTHGRVVWGDATVLAGISKFAVSAIPRWDAWRMLNNRIVEQLDWADGIRAYNRDQLIRAYYQLVKCHIDLGTTLLIFAGKYEDTYAARAQALVKW
ncbi:MAG: hypothetical protein ACHP8A_18470, partial [Terriglobales bacterium]